jgi:CheY-like chemotaxis protein
LVARLIEEAGFTVVIARDGREARKLLQSQSNFIAAVFEVVIPHISGPDLVRYMKREAQLKDIPVIMMTGSRGARLLYESLHAGATVLVPEPFSISQLQHLLHMLVHS